MKLPNNSWRLGGACLLFLIAIVLSVYGRGFAPSFVIDEVAEIGAGKQIRRTILLLFDSTDTDDEILMNHRVHRTAGLPLNHLGCRLKLHDVSKGFPTDDDLQDVHGILTWFQDEQMIDAAGYCRWLQKQVHRGRRLVVLEQLGATIDKKSGKRIDYNIVQSVWRALGLDIEDDQFFRPLKIRIVEKDSEMAEFERDLEGETGFIQTARAIDATAKVYLRLQRTDQLHVTQDAIVVTSKGGWVMPTYAFHENIDMGIRQWRIDPFRFFSEAFDLSHRPVPDPTTQNGRRLWFSHIDGDGFVNESWRADGSWSSRVIYEELLSKYELPVTASFVTCRQDEDALGSKRSRDLAREILKLPNIEAASHGHAHPSDWQRGTLTLKNVPGTTTYSAEREIRYSTAFINQHLCPRGKKVKVFLWTGACNPGQAELGLCDQLGLLNINGGDGRMDGWYPSYAGIAPFTGPQIGKHVQVYSGMANENILTNEFEDPLYGFGNIVNTVKNSESPQVLWTKRGKARRVAPINIYYHWYIADTAGSWQSLRAAIFGSIKQDIAPVFASEWAHKVLGFRETTIAPLVGGGWKVSMYGHNRTLRFDESKGVVDLSKSINVMGWRRQDHRLWVHLREGETAQIVLADSPTQDRPWLHSAEQQISNWTVKPESIRFETTGFGRGLVEIGGLNNASWQFVSNRETVKTVAFKNGLLQVQLPAGSWRMERSR